MHAKRPGLLPVTTVSTGIWALVPMAFFTAGGSLSFWPSSWTISVGRNVSGIIGILYTSVAIGALIGPTAGFVFEVSDSYTRPILASAWQTPFAARIAAAASKAESAAASAAR